MNARLSAKPTPRILPVVILGLALFAVVKAADLWVGFAGAQAEETERAPAQAVAPILAEPSDDLSLHLADRRAELDRREAALDTRETLLKAAESRIELRLTELSALEDKTAAQRAAQIADQEAQIGKLSDAYERMKPRDAARIFEALDAALLGPVAAGMRTQSLAAVLGEMEAGKAKELTELLADRRVGDDNGDAP